MTIYDKLLEVQKEIGAIKKDSTNPFFKSKYFDINALLEQVKPTLNKHGIVLTQALTHIDGKLALNTSLALADRKPVAADDEVYRLNESVIWSTCPIPEGADAQKTGSAITYFRRYALQSLLALEAEDDDANLASKPAAKVAQVVKPVAKPVVEDINSADIPW
jgi:hypothetical protein